MMVETTPTTPSCVGIDISKSQLDVHIRPAGLAFSVPRNPDGLIELTNCLLPLKPTLVVLEATGGFEITVAAAIAGAGLQLAVFNPRQIRDFARACGQLAKTDTLDAKAIALFAERMQPEARLRARAQLIESRLWVGIRSAARTSVER